MKFKVFKDKKGEWRFYLLAMNNKIIAMGESYKTKRNCLKTIGRIISLEQFTTVEIKND